MSNVAVFYVDAAKILGPVHEIVEGNRYRARCPAHDDQLGILEIRVDDGGRLVLECPECLDHSRIAAVFTNVIDKPKGAVPFRYVDRAGRVVRRKIRMPDKTFFWQHWRVGEKCCWEKGYGPDPDVPMFLPDILAQTKNYVVVVEGEKDAQALQFLEFTATTLPHGADGAKDVYGKKGKKKEYAFWECFRGKRVVVLCDNDEAGRRHQHRVADELYYVAKSVRVVDLAEHVPQLAAGEDVTDAMVKHGVTAQDLRRWFDETKTGLRGMVVKKATDYGRRKRRYLRRGALTIELSAFQILWGNSGVGKGLVGASWAGAILARRAIYGENPNKYPNGLFPQAKVVVLADEESIEEVVLPRLDLVVDGPKDLDNLLIIEGTLVPGRNRELRELDLTRDVPRLEQVLRDHPDVRYVFIDPWESAVGDSDVNSSIAVRNALRPVTKLAMRAGVAIVGVKHNRKAPADDPVLQMSGSHVFAAMMRRGWCVMKDPDNRNRAIVVSGKANYDENCGGAIFEIVGKEMKIPETSVNPLIDEYESETSVGFANWVEMHNLSLDELVHRDPDERQTPGKRERAKACIKEMLDLGPRDVDALKKRAKEEEMSWGTFKAALAEYGDRIESRKKKGGAYGSWERLWKGDARPNFDDQVKKTNLRTAMEKATALQKEMLANPATRDFAKRLDLTGAPEF